MNQTAFRTKRADFGSADIRTDRDIEYAVFTKATFSLRRAEMSSKSSDRVEGLTLNNALWTTLTADLAHEENKLPQELRATLLSLGLYSIRYGQKSIQNKDSLQPLIDINQRMMKGLRGDVSP